MQAYCEEISATIGRYGDDFSVFLGDLDFQKSVSFSIFQIGELSIRLSDGFRKETASIIDWPAIRGMRNIVAHDYGSVNLALLWETAKKDIPVLEAFCREKVE